jgi:hypothetical protein
MATRSLLCAESEAQRVPLLVRARDGGSDGAGAASGSLGPSSRRSLSVAATLVTALVVGAVVAVARGDAAGVATRLGGYAFPGAALGEGVGDAATRAADASLASDVANARGAGGVSSSARRDRDEACKIGYYYHIPKTGGGSLVRYFGHLPEVELLRYEATIHVPKENKTLWYWEHQSSEDHWEKFVVPHALKPGKKLIAHHWGRFGMVGMEKRLERLRTRAEALGCQFMASTTFREPVERDVSDEVFHRITGAGAGTYLGDEQLRFFLLNSQRENARFPPDMAKREEFARDALSTAERILRKNFDLVATIEDLELQKNAFLAFFDVESSFDRDNAAGEFVSQTKAEKSGEEEGSETKGQTTGFAAGFAAAIESAAELGTAEQRIERRREERRAEARDARAKAAKAAAAAAVREPSSASQASAEGEDKASRAAAAAKAALAAVDGPAVDGPTLPGQPLGHVHKIDYAELGIDDAEMQRLREKFAGTNSLDTALYETARELATANSALRVSDGVYRAQQHVRAAGAAAAMAGGSR